MMRTLLITVLVLLGREAWAFSCPSPGEPVRVIRVYGFYAPADPTHSTIDPERQERYRTSVAPLRRFQSTIAGLSDQADRDPDARACAENLLASWAKARALLEPRTPQARLEQQWLLATLAIVHFKLGSISNRNVDSLVKFWLAAIAEQVVEFYKPVYQSHRTNLTYWAALSVGVTALVTSRDDFWRFSEDINHLALTDIDAEGFIASELRRGPRAASYHAFAAQPLAVLELFRQTREGRRSVPTALQRLIALVEAEAAGARRIDARTGVTQLRISPMAWLNLWHRDHEMVAGTESGGQLSRLGGTMGSLYTALARHGLPSP
jgi:poly(beta-D-mannuronate) lyase